MGIGSISGYGGFDYTPYSTALSSGPSVAPQTDEVESNQAALDEQRRRTEAEQTTSAGNTTPTRGQTLNITV